MPCNVRNTVKDADRGVGRDEGDQERGDRDQLRSSMLCSASVSPP
jgi:hypothetical protein